jgi:DNA primase
MEPGDCHKKDYWLSLGGLNSIALDHFLAKWNGLKNIIFCIDGDTAADEAYIRLGTRYANLGYAISRHAPLFKDWNMQLLRGGYSFPVPPLLWGIRP